MEAPKKPRRSPFKYGVKCGRNFTVHFGEEGSHCLTVADFLRQNGVTFIHVPNERKSTKHDIVALKMLGMEPGASDYLIFNTPPNFPHFKGLALEMKAPKGRTTANQEQWQQKIKECGWMVAVCYGASDAIDVLTAAGYNYRTR